MMIHVIVNPVAGNGLGEKIGAEIDAELTRRGIAHRCQLTEYPSHATEIAARAALDGAQTVLSVGGDGTSFETACGLLHSDTALGIIPAGTGNDFIKSIGSPKKPLAALDFVLSHPPRAVDVGKLNDKMFLNVCGVGFDVMVLDYSLKAKKYVRGLLPYLYGVILGIFNYKPIDITYSLDNGEQTRRSVLIFSVANGKYIGGGIPIAPSARVDDGFFDAVIVDAIPRWKIPFYLPGLMMGKLTGYPITKHVLCKQVHLASKNMRLNVDGEVLTMNEAHFSTLPEAIKLHW